jgi:peptidyl-prolyl cis-trans isomerase D
MFDFVRKHSKWIMVVLFVLIIPSFVIFGVNGYDQFRDEGATVAVVDGQKILESEWDAAHKNEIERVRESMPSLDPKLLDAPEAKYATLERLVRDKVIAVAAQKFRLTATDQRLAMALQEEPAIASLRKPDGTLDMERYQQLVGAQGMSPAMFEARVRDSLITRQVLAGIGGSGLKSAAVSDLSLNAFFERREVQLARFSTSAFLSKVSLTDAQLEQYYKDHATEFQAAEQANIEYVVLDVESVRKGITLKEEDIKTYYDQNATRLAGTEERRASHILINAPKTASAGERAKAKTLVDGLLAQVKKAPESFAQVAKQHSQDPGSGPNGGDLDFFGKGAMVKPFEDTVFAMKKGDISDVVETEFGYHIIRLTDIKAPQAKTLEELRPQIENDLKKQEAQKVFAENAEGFRNGVYEQADNLKSIADRLKLEVKTASGVQRKPTPAMTGVLANPKFLEALFSPDSIEKKQNTPAVDVASNQLVSGRIVSYTAARILPFAEVKDRVRDRAQAVQAAELARKEGTQKLAAWKAAPASAAITETLTISRDQAQQLPLPITDAALRADSTQLPTVVGVDLGAQGYAIVKVNKVLERDTKGANVDQDRKQYTQWWTSAEAMAYYNTLKERFKAEIKVAKPVAQKDELLAQP